MNYKLLILCGFILLTQFSSAENKSEVSIFKCVNNKGKTFYNDKPCPVSDRETLMKSVKDPLNTRGVDVTKSVSRPVLLQKNKKDNNYVDSRKKLNIVAEAPIHNELEGDDEVLKAQLEREDRARVFAGASDADERRAFINDQYANPPEGSRKPNGSNVQLQELTEEMVNEQMEMR